MKTKSATRVSRTTSDAGRSDDGPRPRFGYVPTKKNPNASDRFYTDHQAEYEARSRRSEDRVQRVEEHNSGYPKLRDELDNRRAISKPTALSAHEEGRSRRVHTTKCPVCGGYERQRRSKRRYTRNKSRITKRKPKPRKYRGKKPKARGVPHYSKMRTYGTDTQTGDGRDFQDTRASTSIRIERAESEVGSRKSDVDSKNPETHPSVSSYDSYLSMDHEPMD